MEKKNGFETEVFITDLLVRVTVLEKILVKLNYTTREELTTEAGILTEQITAKIIEEIKRAKSPEDPNHN